MPKLRDRKEAARRAFRAEPGAGPARRARDPVGAVDPSAERMAIESALEAGVAAVLVNLLTAAPYPTTSVMLGHEGMTLPHEEDLDAVRATADRARALGVKTELLRVSSRRPVKALLEVVSERTPGCSCSGPTSG